MPPQERWAVLYTGAQVNHSTLIICGLHSEMYVHKSRLVSHVSLSVGKEGNVPGGACAGCRSSGLDCSYVGAAQVRLYACFCQERATKVASDLSEGVHHLVRSALERDLRLFSYVEALERKITAMCALLREVRVVEACGFVCSLSTATPRQRFLQANWWPANRRELDARGFIRRGGHYA